MPLEVIRAVLLLINYPLPHPEHGYDEQDQQYKPTETEPVRNSIE